MTENKINKTWFKNKLKKGEFVFLCNGRYTDDFAHDLDVNYGITEVWQPATEKLFSDWYIKCSSLWGDKDGIINLNFANCEDYEFRLKDSQIKAIYSLNQIISGITNYNLFTLEEVKPFLKSLDVYFTNFFGAVALLVPISETNGVKRFTILPRDFDTKEEIVYNFLDSDVSEEEREEMADRILENSLPLNTYTPCTQN